MQSPGELLNMSWAADEWKDGLPAQALQKISQLETQLDRFKKDRDQKQCQLESLEVVSNLLMIYSQREGGGGGGGGADECLFTNYYM